MALWNNSDSEASKPSWLTEEQRRNCVRTVRGWEIPTVGSGSWNILGATSSTGFSVGLTYQANDTSYRSSSATVPMELLVAIPTNRLNRTGSNQNPGYLTDFRGATQAGSTGATFDLPNYKPYITWPVHGSTIIQPWGVTSYFPIIAADANSTDNSNSLSISVTGSGLTGVAFGVNLFASMQADTQAQGATTFAYPTSATGPFARNRGFGGISAGASVGRVTPAAVTNWSYVITATVTDPRGLTGVSAFTLQVTGS
jgi:hypothetical protein